MDGLPGWLLLTVIVSVFAGFAVGGQILVHRTFRNTRFVEHNEVAGFSIAVAGVLYAVVLGFMTVVVWQQYDGTRERLAAEASAAGNAWHMAVGLPPEVRHRVRSDVQQYARAMWSQEWPLMREGSFSKQGDALIIDATEAGGTFDARLPQMSNAQQLTLVQLGVLHDARSQRIAGNAHGLSGFEWMILIVGAIVVLALCWLFGMENPTIHFVLTGGVAVIIASVFAMLLAMQYPFRGQLAIDAEPWLALEQHMPAMDRGASAAMRM